jgi:hypothetical protein
VSAISGIYGNSLDQRGLQIAAVDHPIGRAIVLLDGRAERYAGEHAPRVRTHHLELFRNDDLRRQPLAKAEPEEDAGGIGGELDTGAGLLKPRRRLQQGDAEVALRQGQRRRQPANAGASDHDGARGGHGSCLRRCPAL